MDLDDKERFTRKVYKKGLCPCYIGGGEVPLPSRLDHQRPKAPSTESPPLSDQLSKALLRASAISKRSNCRNYSNPTSSAVLASKKEGDNCVFILRSAVNAASLNLPTDVCIGRRIGFLSTYKCPPRTHLTTLQT